VVHEFNAYFVKDQTTCKTKYTEDDTVNIINFLIDNIEDIPTKSLKRLNN